ncbi:unnamed protein product [Didymodactylos carnosus]|uniref:Uncharacterized protein n=1 Tax=Didymodactylos carnosus TaxID=1234261 RepID=A0A814M6I5_9BILA|nr:unnamed protein product [Didymodactylos carnosus]CAF3840737.1 unnamed protein product [Didymodactylos carnosus]
MLSKHFIIPLKLISRVGLFTTTTTTSSEGSPEIDCYYMDEEANHNDSDSTEESSEDEEYDDGQLFLIDYTTTTLVNLPQSAKHILQTIEDCKSLVTYVKKASLNHEIQNLNQTTISTETVTSNSSSTVQDRAITSTTLHQSSIIRWLSLSDLLESIKRSYNALRIILTERKEEHRIDKINMTTVQQLINFLRPWKYVLYEVQKGNSPSLFTVFPCIAFLKADLINREKKEKPGKVSILMSLGFASEYFLCMKFFAKCAYQLLNSMFQIDDFHMMGAFLHPNYKTLRSATST